MRIHHLNCISNCPLGGRLMDAGPESVFARGSLTCHCMLVETEAGLVLCDTGFGLQDVANPKARLGRFFLAMNSPDFRSESTAVHQIEALGFDVNDVRHIILTHLDFDHAGGLSDFPKAKVHLLASEKQAAMGRRTWLDKQRFRPAQWPEGQEWISYRESEGSRWFGFDRVQQLNGLPPEIVLVPLIGHTLEHVGIAIQTDVGWVLDAGDAYFFRDEMRSDRPYCTPGLRFYQWMMEKDRAQRLTNQERLRNLVQGEGHHIKVFCSHDVVEFEALAGHPGIR